ncbi:MAG: Mov34/MPN/PAD family protein [Thermoleophilia bacterium]|nr:Mov34/MPN/PAD family protein [Thermoleophilia bacterium]
MTLARVEEGAFVVSGDLFGRMVEHARAAAPNECCGLGLGAPGAVAEFHPLDNVHETPVTRYEIAAADQLRLHLRAEDEGWDTTLVFHSHPATEPYPSATDLALAGWPDAVYAILGLAGPEPLLRAYRIRDGEVAELDVSLS